MRNPHPALQGIFEGPKIASDSECDRDSLRSEQTTSLSLAQALAVGCLSRLNSNITSVNIWDPAAGSGFAGFLLANALQSAGMQVRYRGQDMHPDSVLAGRRRFEALPDAELAAGDTLANDLFEGFEADLVIVDAPWGMSWANVAVAVESRRNSGAFGFGLPQQSDSTWLFISLALEKLRSAEQGGGRVAALVAPSALSAGGATGAVRQRIVDAGLLESITRLPEGLAPNTAITLYLLTFTNSTDRAGRGMAAIADLQTQFFMTERRHRSMPVSAFDELEFVLRTRRPGPRNRTIRVEQLIRREALLSRHCREDHPLTWRLTTYNNTAIDGQFLESRYGADSGISIDTAPSSIIDLDPSPFFGDDSRDLLKDLKVKGWTSRRLSQLLIAEPVAVRASTAADAGSVFIPTTHNAMVSTDAASTGTSGRVLSVRLDADLVVPSFIAAWLNSEQGVSSRLHAIEASSSGTHPKALRSDPRSLMRWADELIVPVPARSTQVALASADEKLGSYHAELSRRRESIWVTPESAADVVNRIASAFEETLNTWLDQLPFPIASALWTAETANSPGEQQRAYLHAWEAIVAFHATVLLSAIRCDPVGSRDVEASIAQTLREQHLGIERASFGTWVVIVEKTSKHLRDSLERNDPDDVARVRNAFGDLSQTGIERLVSKEVVKKFKELNSKRNRWSGHAGYTSDDEWRAQVASLIADLTDLRQLLGNVWTQLLLVRAGSADRTDDGYVQKAEVAVGTRSPFRAQNFIVGEPMVKGALYLSRDESQSPLRLGQFVQLRAAPRDAKYTTYFYNRTEGDHVRLVSYQQGPESEVQTDVASFRAEFGSLASKG